MQEIIGKDKMDSFNLPLYSPSLKELRTLINKNGCFGITRLESNEPTEKSKQLFSTNELRSGFENIIGQHFGNEILEELFQRYAKKIERLAPVPTDGLAIGLFVLLKRNAI